MNARVDLISQAEYARRRGVAKSAVAKAVKEGRITLINGKIDPAVADIQWAQNTRTRIDGGRPASEQGAGMGEAVPVANNAPQAPETPQVSSAQEVLDLRVRKEKAAVEREERENAREAGLLVSRSAVRTAVFDAFRALRDEILSAPVRAAPAVIGLGDSRDIERVFSDELRKAFANAEKRMRAYLPAELPAETEAE